MDKTFVSWTLEARYKEGKRFRKTNLTIEFGTDKEVCKVIEDKLTKIEEEMNKE